mgnify:CR=1 FL=1
MHLGSACIIMQQQLTPITIIGFILAYFLVLIGISYFTSRNANNEKFFLAGRQSKWWMVAIGMIGASLSGVTFMSVPGDVGKSSFSYFQVVLGYLVGYLVIALVLLPLYYRLRVTSIYSFLEKRFGFFAYKTGAGYFLLSRTIGSALRLYLVALVLQKFVLGPMGAPFFMTVAVTIVLIWVYTFKGGINTIIYTDVLQTVFMLAAVVLTILSISHALETDVPGMIQMVSNSKFSKTFFFEGGWGDSNNFYKQFIGGALITIVMTGLDQDMMQKNLTCPNIRDAQKNVFTFSIILVGANLLFLTLGALLYLYSANIGIDLPAKADELYPTIALRHLPLSVSVMFILGVIAAAYSSADSTLTALTTSFCVDFLNFEKRPEPEETKKRWRRMVHIGFSVLLFLVIIISNELVNESVIYQVLKVAGYTYGPLLGLFTFGMFTKLKVRDNLVLPVCLAAPVITILLDVYSARILYGFEFGYLNLAVNGLLTFLGLFAISYRDYTDQLDQAHR